MLLNKLKTQNTYDIEAVNIFAVGKNNKTVKVLRH